MADKVIESLGGPDRATRENRRHLGPDLQAQHRRPARQPEHRHHSQPCSNAGIHRSGPLTRRAWRTQPRISSRTSPSSLLPWLDAVHGADGLCLVTHWPDFAAIDLGTVKAALDRPAAFVDLRNVFDPQKPWQTPVGITAASVVHRIISDITASLPFTPAPRRCTVCATFRNRENVCVETGP